jgi:hypothetical protein
VLHITYYQKLFQASSHKNTTFAYLIIVVLTYVATAILNILLFWPIIY